MKIKMQLDKVVAKLDGVSLRERVLIFLSAALIVVTLIDSLFLAPQLVKQKKLAAQVIQQQEKMKEVQAQIAALLQARQENVNSPQHQRIQILRQQIAEGDSYLKERRDKLVPPEKMAALLEQMLYKNDRLKLVALNTLPVSLLIEPTADAPAVAPTGAEKQIYKHGVTLTVRGSYEDLRQYMKALEKLPTQMFWGGAKMEVIQHPTAELTLTLYTLSLDKTWLQV